MSRPERPAPALPLPQQDATDVVEMKSVAFRWPGRPRFEIAVDRFIVARAERLLLLGPSGAGKSTLLSLMCGIVTPDAGTVSVLGKDLVGMRGGSRDHFRAEHFGIIFQMFNLLPYATALDNVLLPLSFAPGRRCRATRTMSAKAEATRLLGSLALSGTLATDSLAATLSVGQQQRVAAARALIGAPDIVLADEPTSALDSRSRCAFLDLLFEQVEAAGATLVMVSHDETHGERFSRIIHLRDIAVIRQGDVA